MSTINLGASKISQLEDNLAAIRVTLSAEDVSKLDGLTRPNPVYPGWFNEKTSDSQVAEALG